MSVRHLMLNLCLLAPLASAHVPEGDSIWMPDLGPALQRAAVEKKDLLVDFTGSDWCGWCVKLHDEVFGEQEFLDWAQERYVLVALDFPRDGGKVWEAMGAELRARNQAELAAFGVEGFPSVLLMSAEGVAYGRTGYQPGGAAAYIEHLAELDNPETKSGLAESARIVAELGDDEQQAELEAVYELVGNVVSSRHEKLVAAIRRLDPEDSRLVLARQALTRYMEANLAGDEEPEWAKAVAALGGALQETPSLAKLPEFQFYSGMIQLNAGDIEAAKACLTALDGLADVNPRMREALVMALAQQEAGAEGEASGEGEEG